FDLVFLDPPYASDGREETLTELFSSRILSPRARVVVEGPAKLPLAPLPGVCVVDERRYGDTALIWLEPRGRSRGGDE
ncbi:MAG TPA: 16S rRNA (guanine(966)-N(2))-methyltransferase RsmD, partial [Deltaproteobacteria bacterium]|nr:16S rRNA (guanine(966)-N(2))-methyltransferase RsmD [Deltaproteobacteria bacterium]